VGRSGVAGERDLVMDLDAPAGDADFLDDESQEALAAVDFEVVASSRRKRSRSA
jgi:hypothetical protein